MHVGTVQRVAVSLGSWVLVSHWIGCAFFLLGWPGTRPHGSHTAPVASRTDVASTAP